MPYADTHMGLGIKSGSKALATTLRQNILSIFITAHLAYNMLRISVHVNCSLDEINAN